MAQHWKSWIAAATVGGALALAPACATVESPTETALRTESANPDATQREDAIVAAWRQHPGPPPQSGLQQPTTTQPGVQPAPNESGVGGSGYLSSPRPPGT